MASATRQLAVAPEPGAQRLALDQRHGVVEQVAGLAGGEQRDDVGMLERRGEVDLAAEPVQAQAGRELGREHLDHHLPAEAGLLGHEHAAHGAAAQLAPRRSGRRGRCGAGRAGQAGRGSHRAVL